MAEPLFPGADEVALLPFTRGIEDAQVLVARVTSSDRADEIVTTRANACLIFRVNFMSREYDNVLIHWCNPFGGDVVTRARSINGEQVGFNTEATGTLVKLLSLAGVGLGLHMAVTQLPYGPGGVKHQLQPYSVAEERVQDVAVGVLPVEPRIDPNIVMEHTLDQIEQLLERQLDLLVDALDADDEAGIARALNEMERLERLVQRYMPEFELAWFTMMNKCKYYNARLDGEPDFALPGQHGYVGILLPSGRFIKARCSLSWAWSINFRSPDVAHHLAEVDIHSGRLVAFSPLESVPAEDRLPGVNHYYLVTRLPRLMVAASAFLEMWQRSSDLAPYLGPARVGALQATIEGWEAV